MDGTQVAVEIPGTPVPVFGMLDVERAAPLVLEEPLRGSSRPQTLSCLHLAQEARNVWKTSLFDLDGVSEALSPGRVGSS